MSHHWIPKPDASGKRTYGSYRTPENPERCAVSCMTYPYGSGQCSRKRGKGPGGLYCGVHDPEAVKAREERRYAKARLVHDKENARHREYERDVKIPEYLKKATVEQLRAELESRKP